MEKQYLGIVRQRNFYVLGRAWRQVIHEHITDTKETYHQLRLLMTECEEANFHVLLQHFLAHIQGEKRFYTYFCNGYLVSVH